MAAVLLAGLLIGLGCWLVVSSLSPARMSLAVAVQRLDRVDEPAAATKVGLIPKLGRVSASILHPSSTQSRSADLAIVGRTSEAQLGIQILAVVAGLMSGPLVGAVAALGGFGWSYGIPAWVSMIAGVLGWFVPAMQLRQVAAERRREFRQCLGAYADLVVLLLAADEGVTGALEQAALAGDAWPFVELRRALGEARLTAVAPWSSMQALGERLDVPELIELANAAHLAGSEGASVRHSLTAKARTLRDRAMAGEETEAEQASTRMVFPLLIMVLAFVGFVGYPAIVAVINA